MIAKDLKKTGIVNNDYQSVVLGRRCCRSLDATYKVSREEIEEIIKEALVATPTAVDSHPYKFLIIESDEAKRKLDDIMWPVDKSRVLQCSFAVIPLADRKWIDEFDAIVEGNRVYCPAWYETLSDVCSEIVPGWYESLTVGTGELLNKSVNFQAGLVSMSLMFAARAHGLDTGFLDAWTPEQDLDKIFDLDLKRFVPEGVICFGKNVGPFHDSYRPEVSTVAKFL